MKKFQKYGFYVVAALASFQLLLLLSDYQNWGPRDRSWLTTVIAGVWLYLRQGLVVNKTEVSGNTEEFKE